MYIYACIYKCAYTYTLAMNVNADSDFGLELYARSSVSSPVSRLADAGADCRKADGEAGADSGERRDPNSATLDCIIQRVNTIACSSLQFWADEV